MHTKANIKCFMCFDDMEVKEEKLQHYPYRTKIYKYVCKGCGTVVWK